MGSVHGISVHGLIIDFSSGQSYDCLVDYLVSWDGL